MIKYTDLLKTCPKENLRGTSNNREKNVTSITRITIEILNS